MAPEVFALIEVTDPEFRVDTLADKRVCASSTSPEDAMKGEWA
jgi:hypothetical protein